MRYTKRNTVTVSVLTAYILVGAVGFWGTLSKMFLFGEHPWKISQNRIPTPPPLKVVWTQQKHYPSPQQDNVPLPAILTLDNIRSHSESFVARWTGSVPERTSDFLQSRSPRAPPQS